MDNPGRGAFHDLVGCCTAVPGHRLDDVVPGDYIKAMKTAGVRELKTHLSGYLRDVARGDVVLVTDRGRVVAELRPPGAGERAASPEDLRLWRLVERGFLRPAAAPGSFDWSAAPRVRLAEGTSKELLDAERGET
jgi:antitoxin (DNA-binding transcriptional repressor) of toxin-antitoxin stability system